MAQNISQETQTEALKVAKAIHKPGQNKEQTKLIAQGIEKGISEYKKQQKVKARERDKQRKQDLKIKNKQNENSESGDESQNESLNSSSVNFPWILLVLSWVGFLLYEFLV